ncbi:Glucose-methanol-choline oxidoreductase, N-terminal [Penicillium camemberti]|uniref:Glucose-methanol-choline oxidoreductase, N-terminal n=1 Tax=Penicillium camemberti (strain FM 013) TaxID=1429867 RepID=A0A0G4P9M6_PENC3|nr:Glucose-methanol-choline oxidoreductase, N-terminal [Penicillium camemberti]
MTENPKTRIGGVILSDARRFDARKEVLLAASTLRTPHILRLSGIGPRNYLSMLFLQ